MSDNVIAESVKRFGERAGQTVMPGQVWIHSKTGRLYEVLSLVLDEASLTWRVVYRKWQEPYSPVFSRCLSQWFGMMNDPLNGQLVPRFILTNRACSIKE